ncbi:MAG: histidinol-phosphate transaminase [Bacteroidales bacterium]|jgi:histidinol-phosphate aminotransferase
MIDINKIVRSNILSLQPYSSARSEFHGKEGIFLDANENPFGSLNRYPDPFQRELKEKIAEVKKCNNRNVVIGNGSDEIIDLAFRIFCDPGKDKAMIFSPTYGMYRVAAEINNAGVVDIPLDKNFQIDPEKVNPFLDRPEMKLIFVCSPNNPTGNSMDQETITFLLDNFRGIVIVDEAYLDFSEETSWISRIEKYNNLLVIQTFSKAWGLAAARLGMAFAGEEIVALLNKVKPPYNISSINQQAALYALQDPGKKDQTVALLMKEKERLVKELSRVNRVKRIYPSRANFILIEVDNADYVYRALISEGVITRNRHREIANCLRVTVGAPAENERFINAINKIK